MLLQISKYAKNPGWPEYGPAVPGPFAGAGGATVDDVRVQELPYNEMPMFNLDGEGGGAGKKEADMYSQPWSWRE